VTASAAEPVPGRPAPKLTARQLAALRLAANGHTNASSARVLGNSAAAVSNLLFQAYQRLGVRDRAHAVAVALRLGLIGLDEIALPSLLEARTGVRVPQESHTPPSGAPGVAGGPR
jgi:DNA-binding CsgD family transcriptional regulator